MVRGFFNDGALVCKEKDIVRRRVPAASATCPMLGNHQGLDAAGQWWPEKTRNCLYGKYPLKGLPWRNAAADAHSPWAVGEEGDAGGYHKGHHPKGHFV